MEIIVMGLYYCVQFVIWILYNTVVWIDGITTIITGRKWRVCFITFGTYLGLIEYADDNNFNHREICEFIMENLTYERP